MELTQDEKFVRDELTKAYPQLQINVKNVTGAGAPIWADDLLALSVQMYLEKPIEYQLKVIKDGKLVNFITKVMNFQLKVGKTTKFWFDYRKHSNSFREIFPNYAYKNENFRDEPFYKEKSELEMCIECERKKLDPFQSMLIQRRVEQEWSFKDISKMYNIPYNSLQRELTLVLKRIKKRCSKYM